MKSNSSSARILVIAVLVMLSIAYLLPIYVMFVTSLKSVAEINSGNYLLPTTNPQWINYAEVLFGSPRFRSEMFPRMLNSTIISFSVTALSAFFGGLGGYYLSRNSHRPLEGSVCPDRDRSVFALSGRDHSARRS